MGLLPDIKIIINNNGSDGVQLSRIEQKIDKLMAAIDDLKAKLEAQSTQIDTISTGVATANTSLTGLSDDIAYLKELLANNPTPEQIQELITLADGMGTKLGTASTALSTLGTTLADLDAQTTRPETQP